MASSGVIPLLIGEVSIDVTVTPRGQEQKIRLGGIVHAGRGFWASGTQFAVAAVLPRYLEQSAKDYLAKLGCQELITLGYVSGAPNVVLIFDPTEVDDQEYDTLLRQEKSVELNRALAPDVFARFTDALVFPGSFDLKEVCALLPPETRLHIDVAYDVESVDDLRGLNRPITTIFLSTSSRLFLKTGASGIGQLSSNFAPLGLEAIILKENRGGSRLHIYATKQSLYVPAQLASTVNSVGVGDVFDATYLAHHGSGSAGAAWRATFASSAYAQTTDPDVFERGVERDAQLTLEELRNLGGITLPWEARQEMQIYLAAPDFQKADRRAIERAVSALRYHNFKVRRPVQENGELPPDPDSIALVVTYRKDVELLDQCNLLFAVPTGRDPGTLVEIGLAIRACIPVVVYDPDKECANTMVIAGSDCYSDNLDTCLNAVFTLLSKAGRAAHG
jgi:nucleoside 2-deoxyribosyltransferase